MNVLLIGSGGREHALAWKMAQSAQLTSLFISPGNPGTERCGTNVVLDIRHHDAVATFCRVQGIQLIVIGPEATLVDGLADSLRAAGFSVFGPSAAAAQLEGSKGFTKDLCAQKSIPTAAYQRFSDKSAALAHMREQGAPIVIKADGLAAGKGVTVAETIAQAEAAIEDCFDGGLGAAGAEVVIEECLSGPEISFFCLCDGKTALPFGSAQDHKRVADGDTGPNTGGMGAYSPAPIFTPELQDDVMARIIQPTLDGMAEAGTPFVGVLYAGLMLTRDGPSLIEYNVRFGDPECQVLMPRLQSDLIDLLKAAADGVLDGMTAQWSDNAALSVVMCAPGYPASAQKGSVISGLDAIVDPGVEIFHAGTKRTEDALIADGGRVLAVTARAPTIAEAQRLAYNSVARVDWPEGFYRSDIGWRAL